MNFLKHFDFKAYMRHTLSKLPITLLILAAAGVLSSLFFYFSFNSLNIALVYILAIILIARTTNSYTLGILASLLGVLWVNLVYTYPYMSLNFTMTGYPVTFIGMAAISCITSSMTIHQQKQRQLLKEKDHMLMEAEKEAMRANLLRAISHDLRTPLTSILGNSSAYLEHHGQLSSQEKLSMIENIHSDADWLLHMVENLLAVTRIQEEQGLLHVTKTEEILEEVLAPALERFHRRFPDTLVLVDIPPQVVLIPMDATLIQQVITNLLENAFYHGGNDKPIELTVTLMDKDAVFSVRDHGPGINPDILDTLFDGRGLTQTTEADSHKGMGIGLSICRTILVAHGGQIYARNHKDGAEFIFTLPDWREDYGE